MTPIAPIHLEDGTLIYIEATEDVESTHVHVSFRGEEAAASDGTRGGVSPISMPSFQGFEGTIRAYPKSTLSAFIKLAIARVHRVALELGIQVGDEAKIADVTTRTTENNGKITVECSGSDRD